ncbi:methyl coenzyme M reductase subunit gamma [Rothia mucilaginosa]|uniref:methyl coenzyme M reductase subunit gamma n=1 Tax=Rothia mucilaginosa TaxID=43675 RepID=UPI0026F225BD|nr:methyl coenzyme M reductase subunit gamma [Rothia mucilaginosa]
MKTLNHRFTRTSLATMSVALMLALSACGGGQATSESSATATNAPVASTSASASAVSTPSASTAKASASASVVAEPRGSEVIEIRAADDTNADATIAKESAIRAAKRVVLQDNRLLNAWMHGNFEHTSDEELLKYVAPEKLDVIKRDIQDARNDLEKAGGPLKGQVNIRDLSVTDIFTYDYPDGTSHPYSVLRVKYCEDWTDVRMPDGERAITGEKSTITMEVSVQRLQDGRYVYTGARSLGSGCANS